MTAYSREEEEQLEELKKWWEKYRNPVIYGLLAGIVTIVGVRAWVVHQGDLTVSASNEYEQMQVELHAGNAEAVSKRGAYIIDTYPGTPYAVLAAFALAREHVDKGDPAAARARLEWVVEHGKQPEFVHIARLRLGKLLLAMGEGAQALALLEPVQADVYAAEYEELKGDIYAETGQTAKARQAYELALDKAGAESDTRMLLIKLDNLGAGAG
ncbi:MAG: tetratricopeptide repeat protein [Gammaproteobacteria bacterium]|nr:tetratricopeptide repeat protein [Gammaproteobacteria bacterium]